MEELHSHYNPSDPHPHSRMGSRLCGQDSPIQGSSCSESTLGADVRPRFLLCGSKPGWRNDRQRGIRRLFNSLMEFGSGCPLQKTGGAGRAGRTRWYKLTGCPHSPVFSRSTHQSRTTPASTPHHIIIWKTQKPSCLTSQNASWQVGLEQRRYRQPRILWQVL